MMERSRILVVNSKEGLGDDDDALIRLPPGFRFHPTDEEIVTHYLTPKVLNRTFTAYAIGEADLNKSEPWDLPKKAKMGEKEWFFFCQRDRKYPTGMRTNRATESGYWKATGKDREILRGAAGKLVGMKKTLVFYKGRAPRGEKTNWVMHEFRLEGKFSYYNMPKQSQDEWVVCRVFHKTGGAQQSPVVDHGLNSYVEELLDSPSVLPPLTDHPSAINLDPTFSNDPISYFSHTRPEILQENQDYKNILVSSYNYNFDTNTYQAGQSMSEHQYIGKNLPYLAPASTIYWSNTGFKKEKDLRYIGSEKKSVSQDTGISNEMTATTETSSTSMLSKDGLRQREYNPDDHIGPSTFPELDSLLEY